MIIKKLKETLGQVFHSPEASGTWTNDDIECAIDDNVVDCSEMDEEPFVGIPAPVLTPVDDWFSSPYGFNEVITEKQQEYKEATERLHEDMRKESETVESDNIHQEMYNLATKSGKTTTQLDPIGGSENFQGGSENVHR